MSKPWFEKDFEIPESSGYVAGDRSPRRFWLGEGKSTNIVFVSGVPFRFWEHQIPVKGLFKPGRWVTCIKGIDAEGCPLCDYAWANAVENPMTGKKQPKYGRYLTGLFTVIDRTVWHDKSGREHKDEVKILSAKKTMLTRLKMKAEKHGGNLAGCEFEVIRTTKMAANIGDDWQFVAKVAKLDVPELDFSTLCKPMPRAELIKLATELSGGVVTPEGISVEDDDANEEIPF